MLWGTRILRRSHSSSHRWVQQQSLDPFVVEARRKGYVARSAFKLAHLDDRYHLIQRNKTRAVIDLGCSPGGWCQVIRERAGDECLLLGIDLLPVRAAVPNAVFLQGDFHSLEVQEALRKKLEHYQLLPATAGKVPEGISGGLVDLVTSDMCPNRTGGMDDRQRICELSAGAFAFAVSVLRPGGSFTCKVLGGRAAFQDLHVHLHRWFLRTHYCKPPASRGGSDEGFLVALGKLKEARPPSGRRLDGEGSEYGLDDWPGFHRRIPPLQHKRGGERSQGRGTCHRQ